MVYVEKFVGFWLAGKTVSFVNRVRPKLTFRSSSSVFLTKFDLVLTSSSSSSQLSYSWLLR
jgi:hypothetical protein